MDLLEKFAAVEIKADNRISELDKEYCDKHQAAYEAAINSFKELSIIWDNMVKTQRELIGDINSPTYQNYLGTRDAPTILKSSTKKHIENLHSIFIEAVVRYFNRTYSVTVNSDEVSEALLPKKPRERWNCDQAEAEQYHTKMQEIIVRYQDIVDQIILRLDGRSFAEQAFYELCESCHKAAWNTYKQEPEYERKKDTIRFTGYFCRCKGWPYDGWELQDSMKTILRGAVHYETGTYHVYPLGVPGLLGYETIKCDVTEFPTSEKLKQIKLFKNNRVDLKFRSPAFAEEFINKYLGTVC